jgi:hypothetical protein
VSSSGGPVSIGGSSPLAGHLAADYAVTAALATFMTTGVLAIGVWDLAVIVAGTIPAVALQTLEVEILAGTATATFDGGCAGESENVAGTALAVVHLALAPTVTVTAAGTLVIQAVSSVAGTATIKAATPTSGLLRATGWSANRVG